MDGFTWSALVLYGVAVSDMGTIQPWSKRALFLEDAREVEALRVLQQEFGRLRAKG